MRYMHEIRNCKLHPTHAKYSRIRDSWYKTGHAADAAPHSHDARRTDTRRHRSKATLWITCAVDRTLAHTPYYAKIDIGGMCRSENRTNNTHAYTPQSGFLTSRMESTSANSASLHSHKTFCNVMALFRSGRSCRLYMTSWPTPTLCSSRVGAATTCLENYTPDKCIVSGLIHVIRI